mmetsp:Transcript_48767/g.87675  ORF Transcript_48767/g.87675 Transcript_48767/m.87675 type:complete len:94 (-) Transcript_48767:320-601(-)
MERVVARCLFILFSCGLRVESQYSRTSCAWTCGTLVPGKPCQCNSWCSEMHNCCSDYGEWCLGIAPTVQMATVAPTHPPTYPPTNPPPPEEED